MKKRLIAALCACFLILGTAELPSRVRASGSAVYLLAVNDKWCDLPGGQQPVLVNGVVHVPYMVFDKNLAGADLGIACGLSQDQGVKLTLSSGSLVLNFKVNMGSCRDGHDNQMNFRAVFRNNAVYVPAAAVCDYFGLNYSCLPTPDRGTLIRITSQAAAFNDSIFLNMATLGMTYRYNNIVRSMEPEPAPTPVPTPAPVASAAPAVPAYTPAPEYTPSVAYDPAPVYSIPIPSATPPPTPPAATPSATPAATPEPAATPTAPAAPVVTAAPEPLPEETPSPAPEETPERSREGTRLTMAVEVSQAAGDAENLFREEKALYLFTPESLPGQAAMVRRAAAAGHSLGLSVSGQDLETVLRELETGNDLLSHIARTRTRIVAAPEELTAALTERGWQCWRPNVTGGSVEELFSALDAENEAVRITLPASGEAVSQVLAKVREDRYDLRQPLETGL